MSRRAEGLSGVTPDDHAASPERRVIFDGVFVLADGVGQRLAQRETLLRQLDAGLEQIPPRQLAVSLVRQLISSDLAGYGDGQTT